MLYVLCKLGAFEIGIATMAKEKRLDVGEVYVLGFVPSYLLPKKRPISLDPFMEPFVRDIEDGFINGTLYDVYDR